MVEETGLKIAFYKKNKIKQTSTIYHLCQTEQTWNKYSGGRGVVEMEAAEAQALPFSLAFPNQQAIFRGQWCVSHD